MRARADTPRLAPRVGPDEFTVQATDGHAYAASSRSI